MARVSVLMSCYGTGRWLWEALDSLPWDMPGLEVWVTANGDAPQDVAAVALAERTRPIRAIYRDVTLPLSGSLNVMLARAAGDYVMRLDCGDKLPEGALEAMLAAADAAPRPCIVYGGWIDFGGRERRVAASRWHRSPRSAPVPTTCLWTRAWRARSAAGRRSATRTGTSTPSWRAIPTPMRSCWTARCYCIVCVPTAAMRRWS